MKLSFSIDNVSPAVRHFLIAVVSAGLAYGLPYAAANYTTWGLPPTATAAVGALLPWALMWSTTLSTQYGYVGKPTVPPVA